MIKNRLTQGQIAWILVAILFVLTFAFSYTIWQAPYMYKVHKVKTQVIKPEPWKNDPIVVSNQQRANQVKIMRCWDMKGTPILDHEFAFEQCHLRERP